MIQVEAGTAPVDSTRWQRIQSLFHEAADLPAQQQRGFLEAQCGSDAELVQEVLTLLREDARGDSLLDGDVAQVAHQIFSDRDSTSAPSKEFGPYLVKQVLGEGGMGVVYLAERADLGSQVAIKVLRDAWLSPARRERFAFEQRTLAQLNHPSIARLYDADTSPDGSPFIVMEYVEGIPLTDFCSVHDCTIADRLGLFRDVCEAVLHAHQHAVLHRDLKPSNILVKEDCSVRLLDFGIAKHLQSLGQTVDQTVAGLRLMTPAYASPEQIRGEQVGIQTDVYSLGVVLYELLAGRLPFDVSSCTPAQAEKILTEQEAEKPSAVSQELSVSSESSQKPLLASSAMWGDLDVLCLTAMHKDLRQRYQSVEALLRDIDHCLSGEPLEARPDTAGYRIRKFVDRNGRLLIGAAAVAAAVLALVVFFTVRLAVARNSAIAEAARTQRIQKFMTNLFQGGDADVGPSDSLRVVTLLDRGVQEAQSLNTEPEVQAELYQTLGNLYQNLGKLDQADKLMNLALAQRRTLFGPDHPQVAESLVALGLLRDDQAQLPEAEGLVREGLIMDQRHFPPDHPAVVKATTALGKVLADRGAFPAAIQTLEQAVRLQSSKGPPTSELTTALYDLQEAHFAAGQYPESEALNQRLLPMYRQMYGERHPRVAGVLMTLGQIQNDLGHYPEAESYERQALEMVQSWYGKDSAETATDLTILARTMVYEKRYDQAVDLLQQSLTIKEKFYGGVHPTVASSLNDLGNAASMQGNFDVAESYFQREVNIYRAVYGQHHYLVATALSNLATVYAGKHEWSRAEGLYREAISIYAETQPANNRNTGIARIKLGRTLLRQRRYTEAEAESRAGYDILMAQMDPKVSWLVNARKDLVEEYDALKKPAQAEQFRAESVALQSNPPQVAAKN